MLTATGDFERYNNYITFFRNNLYNRVPTIIKDDSLACCIAGLLQLYLKQNDKTFKLNYFNNSHEFVITAPRYLESFMDTRVPKDPDEIFLLVRRATLQCDAKDLPSQNRIVDAALTSSPNDMVRLGVYDNNINVACVTNKPVDLMLRLIALVPVLVPAGDKGDRKILEILESVAYWNAEKTTNLVKEYLDEYGEALLAEQREQTIRELLGNLNDFNRESYLERHRELEESIREYEAHLRNLRQLKFDNDRILTGFNYHPIDTEELITQVMKLNAIKHIQKYNDHQMLLEVVGPCTYFKEYAENMIYAPRPNKITLHSRLKKAFEKIFIEEEYQLYFNQLYVFNLKDGGISGNLALARSNKIGIPNPHIHGFDCWGSNQNEINKAIRERNDYVYGITLSTIAACDLNFTDYTVIEYLADKLIGEGDYDFFNRPCLKHHETGAFISWKELLEQCEN